LSSWLTDIRNLTLGRARGAELVCHRVEGGPEAGELVATLDGHADTGLPGGEERAAAQRLYDRVKAATAAYRDPDAARAAGYRVDPDKRKPSGRPPVAIHSPNPAYRRDGRVLDPSRPESLVYGKKPDGELALIGALFAVPPGEAAPTLGGPITRWHTHREGGPKMMHVWFTDELRSAYARRPPVEVAQRYGVRVPSERMGGRGAKPGKSGARPGRMGAGGRSPARAARALGEWGPGGEARQERRAPWANGVDGPLSGCPISSSLRPPRRPAPR